MISPTPSYARAPQSQLKEDFLRHIRFLHLVLQGLKSDMSDCSMDIRRRVPDIDQKRFLILFQNTCQKIQKCEKVTRNESNIWEFCKYSMSSKSVQMASIRLMNYVAIDQ